MEKSVRIEQLSKENHGLCYDFYVNPQSCNNPEHFETYVKYTAMGDQLSGRGVTHLIIREDGENDNLAGFITLRATSYIQSQSENGNRIGCPAIEISELAVSQSAERSGVGRLLLGLALYMASELKKKLVGVQYVVLCATEQAVLFYEKFGFSKVTDFYEVPRENWNDTCIPMFLKLPEDMPTS